VVDFSNLSVILPGSLWVAALPSKSDRYLRTCPGCHIFHHINDNAEFTHYDLESANGWSGHARIAGTGSIARQSVYLPATPRGRRRDQRGRVRHGWHDRRARYALYALGVVLLVAGGLTLGLARPSGTGSCANPRISGADTSSQAFTITVNLPCAVPPDEQLWLMTQLLEQGAPVKHSEYYFVYAVRNSPGSQSFAASPPACATRRWYLIAVAPDQAALLKSSEHTQNEAYFGEPIDKEIGKYIVSNVQTGHTCNK
jgi:hypothetical protein